MSKYKVLWVEDEAELEPRLKNRGAKYGIEFVRVRDSEQGKKLLNSQLDDWDFVLLDGRGTKKGEIQNTAGAFEMLREIDILSSRRKIPRCIFTAYAKETDIEAIERSFGDIEVKSKIEQNDPLNPYSDLFSYIITEADRLAERQIVNLYRDVFDAAYSLELPDEHKKTLIKILCSLNFLKYRSDCPGGNDLRKIIEYICKKLVSLGLISTDCLKGDKHGNPTSELNLTDALNYLNGNKSAFILGKRTQFGVIDKEGPIIGNFMYDSLQKALNYTQKDSHDETPIDKQDELEIIDINKSINDYIRSTPDTLYLFISALMVCDFIKAIAIYVENHPDPSVNSLRAYHLGDDISIQFKDGSEYGVGTISQDKNGIFHCGPFIYIQPKANKVIQIQLYDGMKVSIRNISPNRNGNGYRYYTNDYMPTR